MRSTKSMTAVMLAGLISLAAIPSSVFAWGRGAPHEVSKQSATVQHQGAIEVAFSPGDGAEALVIKVIDSARSEIRVLAYSFTSATVVRALVAARRRGVDVAIAVDEKSNLAGDSSGKARAALATLVTAGCHVRTVSAFPIQHSKTIVVDRETVETGSFNYSRAATQNSENVLVVWRNSVLAGEYLSHWQDRFNRGLDFRQPY